MLVPPPLAVLHGAKVFHNAFQKIAHFRRHGAFVASDITEAQAAVASRYRNVFDGVFTVIAVDKAYADVAEVGIEDGLYELVVAVGGNDLVDLHICKKILTIAAKVVFYREKTVHTLNEAYVLQF